MFGKFLDRLSKVFTRRNTLSNHQLEKLFRKNLTILESTLGFSVRNKNYYIKALTHRSYLELYPELKKSNERLEFLGDSVLSMVVGKYLFKNYPDEEEGFLTKSRSLLVNRERLANAAEEIGLQNFILYNRKYLRDSVEGLQTILADGLEALIGAIFLDKGLKRAEEFIITQIVQPFEEDDAFLVDTNYKGQLLELTHLEKLKPPRYVVKKEIGPAHKKEFTIEVYIGDDLLGIGFGKNKKSTEQEASRVAIERIKRKEF